MKKEMLRELRKALGLTQKQAGEACGVTEFSYHRWERGKRSIPANAGSLLKIYAEGIAPPVSAGFTAKPASKKRPNPSIPSRPWQNPPFDPTAGPLIDGLAGAERAIGLVRLIRDALRDSGLA